ncbi:hypothetical protein Pyrfu_0844 [Pyrolobus fumarii 1A]|uniref:Uncharacterized protein n=1 Tax=Pyrolobus fumarii (strain DSM 11204 / 1A) TaxID=694429 RepID=G0EDU4_PYRF1|nr:phosphate-starvation-inducible PsiE family protein [Pyrolobus fumarii]AEM38713.1 hypothetical protein Pyrfu_0844 [Pyrolobus fumarii 1A]
MPGEARLEKIGAAFETIMELLEMAVFAALATAVLVGVVLVLGQTIAFATSMMEAKGVIPEGKLAVKPVDNMTLNVAAKEGTVPAIFAKYIKDQLLAILDTTLILIIGLDVLRTIVVGIVQRELHTVAALEAAILAVVREIIGSEVRHRSIYDLMGYAAVIVLLVGVWLLSRRELLKSSGRNLYSMFSIRRGEAGDSTSGKGSEGSH